MTTKEPHNALIELRERLRLTQADAAKEIGVAREQWNKWETGRQGVTARSAGKIAAKFGGSPADYITKAAKNRGFSAAMLGQLIETLEENPSAVEEIRPLLRELADALSELSQRLEAVAGNAQASQTPPS